MLRPYIFKNRDQLVHQLSSQHVKDISLTWFSKRIDSLEEVVRTSVLGNTFRAFKNMPQAPSMVFRKWAYNRLNKENDTLNSIHRQTDYDRWLSSFSSTLSTAWLREMKCKLSYGHSTKLPNLVMKSFARLRKLDPRSREYLIQFLHVPLDNYTLVGLINCIPNLSIPSSATMKWVSEKALYNKLQNEIRDIAKAAQVPAIYYDVLSWDLAHQERSTLNL